MQPCVRAAARRSGVGSHRFATLQGRCSGVEIGNVDTLREKAVRVCYTPGCVTRLEFLQPVEKRIHPASPLAPQSPIRTPSLVIANTSSVVAQVCFGTDSEPKPTFTGSSQADFLNSEVQWIRSAFAASRRRPGLPGDQRVRPPSQAPTTASDRPGIAAEPHSNRYCSRPRFGGAGHVRQLLAWRP